MARRWPIAGLEDGSITAMLVALADRHPEYDLRQLRALAAANQYRGLYGMTRRFLPQGSHVLDWGCGNGHYSFFLLSAGYRATGYSFYEPPMRPILAERGFRFVPADPAEPRLLPFDDASFDAVASVGVLEHVREHGGDEAGSVQEIARVLRPEGVFLCYHFPNRTSWIDCVARRVPGVHRHEHRYSRGEIERLLRDARLDLLEMGRYGVLPRNLWSIAPRPVRFSPYAAALWDRLDALLGVFLAPIAQNHRFVARKPGR